MKILRTTALLLFGAAPLVLAQDGPRVAPVADLRVRITHVEPAMAVDPGRMEILGTNLRLVSEVRLAGRVHPIVSNDGQRIVIRPGPQAPGFAPLVLSQGGYDVSTDVALLPALAAEYKAFRVRLALHPGATGWYVLSYSFRTAPTPVVMPGVYFNGYLDMDGPQCGALFSGSMGDGSPMVFPWMRLPASVSGGAFHPMMVQALCSSPGQTCFSNVVTLTPFQ